MLRSIRAMLAPAGLLHNWDPSITDEPALIRFRRQHSGLAAMKFNGPTDPAKPERNERDWSAKNYDVEPPASTKTYFPDQMVHTQPLEGCAGTGIIADMAMNLRWVGQSDYDRVAETRLRCYAPAANLIEKFRTDLVNDRRAVPGDFLLMEQDGRSIGTTTSMSLSIWMRGARLPCQGVAYVGTIRTARRGGIANQLMQHSLAKAKERGQVISALMPFRATFYERFGYGFAEKRTDWTIPLSLMPSIDTTGMRYADVTDRPEIEGLRQRFVEGGQCDVETSAAGWGLRNLKADQGFQIVDVTDGRMHGWASLVSDLSIPGKPTLRVENATWDSPAHLLRLLAFLGQQRDQFTLGAIALPSDVPINCVLRETQLPHRPVAHTFAEAKPITRMQIRILDHKRFLEAIHIPAVLKGKLTLAVQECEGDISRWQIELSDGRMRATPFVGDCDLICADKIWASIASGDIKARTAVQMGLAQCSSPTAIELLDALSDGPMPFCGEYF